MADKPKIEYRAGGVRGAVWENEVKKDGKEFTVESIRIERRYKDADGNWQSTNSFRRSDLPLLQAVVSKAFEFLTVTERDPNAEDNGKQKETKE